MTAKTTAQRPSALVQIRDAWAALQFDNAVTLTGVTLENASQELKEVGAGSNKKMIPKYTMTQLLDPDFRLPAPKKQQTGGLDDLMKLPGIKARSK